MERSGEPLPSVLFHREGQTCRSRTYLSIHILSPIPRARFSAAWCVLRSTLAARQQRILTEQARGTQVRICKVNADGSLARDRSRQVCILAVPTFMTIPDLCGFIGQHMDHVLHLRLVHDDARARYLALLDMDSQECVPATHFTNLHCHTNITSTATTNSLDV